MIAKGNNFLVILASCLTWISCQTVQPIASKDITSPKRYNWHQRQIHPSFGVVDRDSVNGTEIEIQFNTAEFTTDLPTFLEFNAHVMLHDSVVLYQKRFQISGLPPTAKGNWSGKVQIPKEAQHLQDVVLKFGPNGLADQFYLNWPLGVNGWQTNHYLQTHFLEAGKTLIRSGKGKAVFASLSDKLPSPPFSTNPPFVPDSFELVSGDSIKTQAGAYIFSIDSSHSVLETVFAMDANIHPQFPEWVTTSEMAGPMRYLCSKEEYDKIAKSTDGPENAMEKFWIQSAGGREKARGLIKTYYQRVWDANHHFTSYAEGWKTDRGMIYLVFGHPEKIELENNLEIWSYTLETGQLQFAFERKQHPLWGEIFILKRNEQYRPHWEFQVSQWRQGRIFK